MSNSNHPSLFRNPAKRMNNVKKKIEQDTLDAGFKALKDQADRTDNDNISIKKMPKYLQVTEDRMKNLGVIDLKPFFRNSPKAKKKNDGGWYMVIPIRRKVRSMTRREQRDVSGQNIAPDTSRTILSRYLYDNRQVSEAKTLNYEPRSKSVTKQRIGNNRHSYTSFRTVSNKSPANSWIINRGKITEDNTSKTMVKNVDRLMKWKLKNGFK